jgi:hypothetical protein
MSSSCIDRLQLRLSYVLFSTVARLQASALLEQLFGLNYVRVYLRVAVTVSAGGCAMQLKKVMPLRVVASCSAHADQ